MRKSISQARSRRNDRIARRKLQQAASAQVQTSLAAMAREVRLLRHAPSPAPPRLLRVAEVAGVLGLGERSVQRLIRTGELPAVEFREGGRRIYRVQPAALEQFIACKKKPSQERGQKRLVRVPIKLARSA